ncbi:MAG TPA: FAD-dependent oxidoreductase [Bryobacteraceae bacterium]|jgi:glycine oxidase|nr:FAD-dependent oxidoreductase [Bryobacteraceae bacterium]
MEAIVVGAGIVGSSIAWRLAQRGARVTLLDAGRAGGEASWAGAGMLAPGGEVTERTQWSDFALHSLRLYPDFVAELQEETGCPIDFQRSGAIEIAPSRSEWPALLDRAERQKSLGIPSRPADREYALFYPDDAAVNPRDVTRALLAACRARNVDVREMTPVTGITAGHAGVSVQTSVGPFAAARAVLAAGAWSGAIPFSIDNAPRRLPGSFPVRGHLIGYWLEPGACPTILRSGHTYILQRSTGFTIAGSSMETVGFDRAINPDTVADIARRAASLLPRLAEAGPPQAWIGFRPRADAHQPQIRRFGQSDLWLAYGHFRNGILLAPATAGRIAAEMMA